MKKLTLIVFIAMMLLFAAAVVIAAENTTHEVSEKEKTLEQVEMNTSVMQKITEDAKETVDKAKEETTETVNKAKEETAGVVTKAKEEATGKKQPGFETTFAAAGLLVAFITLNRRR